MGPQINVIGSFFPSWMLCAAIGIAVAVARATALRPAWAWTPMSARERSSTRASRFSSPSCSGWRCSGCSPWTTRRAGTPGARRVGWAGCSAALIVAGAAVAVVVTLLQWETRPQTDDATVRANFVGIAPQVSGHIVELRVRDNQHGPRRRSALRRRPAAVRDRGRPRAGEPRADAQGGRGPAERRLHRRCRRRAGRGAAQRLGGGRRAPRDRSRSPPMPRSRGSKRSGSPPRRRCIVREPSCATPRTISRASSRCCPRSS